MRKVVIAALAVLTFAPTAAMAASPHLVSGSAAVRSKDAYLVVNAKVAGLGSNIGYNVDIDASNLTVNIGCRNSSGKFPSGTQQFKGTAFPYTVNSFKSDKSGNISISLSIAPNVTGSNCPSGQSLGAQSIDSVNNSIDLIVESVGTYTIRPVTLA